MTGENSVLRSGPVTLCPPQIPRAVARNQTWDAAVKHRPDDSCSHVAVSTMRFRYEYQALNKLCDQLSGLLLFHDTYWQPVRLHDRPTGKNAEEAAMANAVLPPVSVFTDCRKPRKTQNNRCSGQVSNRTPTDTSLQCCRYTKLPGSCNMNPLKNKRVCFM